jgi:hypothetical protein
MARKLDGSYITANTITTTQLQTTVVNQISAGGGPKVTTITYPNNQTATVNTGNESIVLTGTGFEAGVQVYVNGVAAPSVSRTNSTSLTFTTPALTTGTTYPLYVVNSDGGTAVVVPGMVVSAGPVWVTESPLQSWGASSALSRSLVAASDSTVSYALQDGSSLPSGLSLAANGLLSGTLTSPPEVQTTYNFTVTATDLELQKSSKAFSINASIGLQSATGGTITTSGGYTYHVFTSSGTFTATAGTGNVEYLVVAGGGGGGWAGYGGGGGGAGGLVNGSVSVSAPNEYTVTVGGGGNGSTNRYSSVLNPGSNSKFGSTTTAVGGGGGSSAAFPTAGSVGGNGGSGGGGAQRNAAAGGKGIYPGSPYISQDRQGYDGGSSVTPAGDGGGGGGGAAAVGQSASGSEVGGNGGSGSSAFSSWLSATTTGVDVGGTRFIAGGGGGGGITPAVAPGSPGSNGTGGSGGGGAGRDNTNGTNGTNNTGGGGGGTGTPSGSGAAGNGGSGIVIIRYAA